MPNGKRRAGVCTFNVIGKGARKEDNKEDIAIKKTSSASLAHPGNCLDIGGPCIYMDIKNPIVLYRVLGVCWSNVHSPLTTFIPLNILSYLKC